MINLYEKGHRKEKIGENKKEEMKMMNQGKMKKIAASVVVLLMLVTVLAGCESSEKKKAFIDYGQSLSSDAEIWKSISEASGTIDFNRDMTGSKATIKSVIIPGLKKLQTSSKARNDSITDPELKKIDADYMKSCENLASGYEKILAGIDKKDNAVITQGVNNVEAAMNNLKNYATGLQSYMNTYGIKDTVGVGDMVKMFN